ncbi:MAG: hypothetical protein J5677_03580 [Bacteroidales bacterium]|nr:hypothetical protein [Bacteroidales bacterium]
MRERRVIIPLSVRLYLDEISNHIIEISRPEHAVRYVHEMVAEINELSYMADMLPESHSTYIKKHHPNAKRYNIKHGTWCVIFHVEGEYVIVDKILPSSLITN